MRITIDNAHPNRRVHPNNRLRFKKAAEGKELRATQTYLFSGTDANGEYVYRERLDTFEGIRSQIDRLRKIPRQPDRS